MQRHWLNRQLPAGTSKVQELTEAQGSPTLAAKMYIMQQEKSLVLNVETRQVCAQTKMSLKFIPIKLNHHEAVTVSPWHSPVNRQPPIYPSSDSQE
jgi:hypothetical protein